MLTIWTSYHKNYIPKQYNLKENDGIKLFNTSNLLLHNNNINYLNNHLGELCTMYYVWKNNIYSDYIGFQHYRFLLTYNDISILRNNKYDVICEYGYYDNYYETFIRSGFNNEIIFKCIDYISNYLNIDKDEIIDIILNRKKSPIYACNTFICSWNIFNNLCKFIFGLLDYIVPNWKSINNIEYAISLYVKIFNINTKIYEAPTNYSKFWAIYDSNRYFVFLIEWMLSLFFYLKYKVYNVYVDKRCWEYKKIVLDLHNENISIKQFLLWHHKNIFSGIHDIDICNYKNTVLGKYIDVIGKKSFKYRHKYVHLYDNISDVHIDDKTYKCNINEYIDVKSPYDFYENNNYIIKNLN